MRIAIRKAAHCVLQGSHPAGRKNLLRPRPRDPARPLLSDNPSEANMDLFYLGVTVGFFALSWAMVELFDRM